MSWVLAFVGFSLLVVLHEAGHFGAAKAVGMRVEKFSLFFPPTLFSKKIGETEYAIGAIPAGGYVKISGMNPDADLPDEVRTRAYYAQPVWKRVVVIFAGPAVNLLLAVLLLFVFFWAVGAPEASTSEVGLVEKGFPAESRLQSGDRLISIDGKSGDPAVLSKQIRSHRCPGKPEAGCRASEPASVVVERDGRRRSFELTPVYDADSPGGARTRLGFGFAPGPRVTQPIGEAATTSLDRSWFIVEQTLGLPARLLDAERRKEVSGVVGSYEFTRQTILSDLADVLPILAIISLSLAIINLFPFLPLDGGHIFWAVVEKVRGKPIPFSVMERAGVIGFLLLIPLFLIGLTNDIGRISGDGFQVR
ncbi:MAG: M50 family metallopeptidase [Thermoleophilaceae bacterium]